ncbi:MAG: hypothetical protein WBD48_03125 [Pseudolabrys sp.]|jgi:predicted RNA-binding Zn-ribbon protein involved in translation (DUF1610 family)
MGKVSADVLVIARRVPEWTRIHSSVFRQMNTASRWASATAVATGALRFRCPQVGSYVLLTDEKTVARLTNGVARIRCAACGEIHLLTCGDSRALPAYDGLSGPPSKSETSGQTGV